VTGDELLADVRAALPDAQAWLVGGAVRDRLLGRGGGLDLDLALDGDVRAAARRVARAAGGTAFELSAAHGAWRVAGPGAAPWQVDVVALQGGSLEADLAARDLTVNAMAEPLHGGELVDPHGGRQDLAAGRLRMVAPAAFDRDPLRTVRVARLVAELGFAVDPATRDAARARARGAAGASPERVFAELCRLLGAGGAVEGLRLLDDLALTPVVLPEVAALHGVEQSAYHHLDVHAHTLAVLEGVIALERDPAAVLGGEPGGAELLAARGAEPLAARGAEPLAARGAEPLAAGVAALLAEPLADGLTRGGALRWGALLHDVAKPQTRVELPGGRVGFPRHDAAGAAVVRDVLARLRASERLRAHVAALTREHLRLGFLVHDEPLGRRAVHRYLVACAPVEADVTLLSVADRLATRGRKADVAIARHLALARRMLAAALERRSAPPGPPLLRGDVLARELGLAPGPWLGPVLAEVEEARYAGEVATAEEALAHARALVAAGGQPAARDAR
jgi:hypothetical protein